MNLSHGEVNFIEKGNTIYKLGDKVDSIGFIIEGTVSKNTLQFSEDVSSGQWIGIHSLYNGKYTSNFIAETDVSIRIINAESPFSLEEHLNNNPQIQERMIIDFSIMLSQLFEMYNRLFTQAVILFKFSESICQQFNKITENADLFCAPLPGGKSFDEFSFHSNIFYSDYLNFVVYNENPEKAYTDMRSGKSKLFNAQSHLISDIYNSYDELVQYVQRLVNHLTANNESSIIYSIFQFSQSADLSYDKKNSLTSLMKKLLESAKSMEFSLKRKCTLPINIDYFYLNTCIKRTETKENILDNIFDNIPEDEDELIIPEKIKQIPTVGSLEKILSYAEYSDEKREEFLSHLSSFVKIHDKYSKKDEDRKTFKNITEVFYELYESVFLKYVNDTEKNIILDLFLNFGFLDETLLTEEELNFLFNIDQSITDSFPCKIFRIKDWLTEVYFGREFASKNEFDEDYNDYVRMEKKLHGWTKEQEKSLLEDKVKRVQYEIRNMLKYNNRLINGNILTFVPFLHSGVFESTMEKMFLTPESINTVIESIRDIDYSLFYREFMYADREAKIDKELIQKEVFPIIILFPTAGQNGVMWQETTRRRSDSPGRFFMPSFFIGNLEDTILKILGRFRWELCKQMTGLSWNNIQVPSLTSKYFDYVQFYKKNSELSPDRKETLKIQISRCRSKINEVFISDYLIWIKNESSGAIRLNSVARRILATHCPFSKEIRANLEKQPLFEKAMLRYNLDKGKKIKELRNRFIALEKKKATITKELLDTHRFYNDL